MGQILALARTAQSKQLDPDLDFLLCSFGKGHLGWIAVAFLVALEAQAKV